MLKTIPVAQLRRGMYVHEVRGSWIDHSLWRTRFSVDDGEIVNRVVTSGIREVVIDTDRGLDIANDDEVDAVDESISGPSEAPGAPPAPIQVDARTELARAARICATARSAVTSMFQEARMGNAIDAEAATPLVEEISSSVMRNPGALINLARLKTKDDYTYLHSVAVCAMMLALARELGLDDDQVRDAGLAGLLHDVGKAMTPLEILNKPGKLTREEFDRIKQHPEEGWKLLKEGRGATEVALDVCLHHHERIDGHGYPHQLADEGISLMARMGAVCDVYDAITSNRPYKAGWQPTESLRRMTEWANGQFDTTVFRAFVKTIGIYPLGSLVRLRSGRLGLVVDQTGKSLLKPQVKVFFSTRSNAHIVPEIVDLDRPSCNDSIVDHEDPAKWGFGDLSEMWAPVLR